MSKMSNSVMHCPLCKESFVMEKYLKAHITRKHHSVLEGKEVCNGHYCDLEGTDE